MSRSTLLLAIFPIILSLNCGTPFSPNVNAQNTIKHSEVFNVNPVIIERLDTFASGAKCLNNVENEIFENESTKILSFSGTEFDNSGQIDPQIAVGGNYVLHLSNSGAIVYDKKGNIKKSINLDCFTKSFYSFDPKIFFDRTNKFFGFGVWDGYNDAEKKPMRLMFSQSDNPLLRWSIYSIAADDGVDGGSIGYGEKWIVYRYDEDRVLITNTTDVKQGNPTKFYKFKTLVGQPAYNQDNGKTYTFYLDEDKKSFLLQTIDDDNGVPVISEVWSVNNPSQYIEPPPSSQQMGTNKLVSSGDFRPKNVVIQNNSLWFSHIVNLNENSAIEWFQLSVKDGTVIQKGLISKNGTNYIQPTIAVNTRGDMAINFEETNSTMNISVRVAYRLAGDPKNTIREVINVAEGNSPYFGSPENTDKVLAWGDYSGSVVDGDNGIDMWFAQSYAKDTKVKIKVFRLKL